MAGAAATLATYPADVMRTVLAAQGHPRVYHSLLDAARGGGLLNEKPSTDVEPPPPPPASVGNSPSAGVRHALISVECV